MRTSMTAPKSSWAGAAEGLRNLVLSSVAMKVLDLVKVPVTLVK